MRNVQVSDTAVVLTFTPQEWANFCKWLCVVNDFPRDGVVPRWLERKLRASNQPGVNSIFKQPEDAGTR